MATPSNTAVKTVKVDLPAEMREHTSFLYNYELSGEDIDVELRSDINDVSADYELVSE